MSRRQGFGEGLGSPTLRHRFGALRLLPRFLSMVWRSQPWYAAAIVVIRFLRAMGPLALLWVGKLIVDTVVSNLGASSPNWERLIHLILLEFAIAVLLEFLSRISSLLESLLGDLFANDTSVRIMQHAAMLDLRHFEDPDFYDKMKRARRHTLGRSVLFDTLLEIAQAAVTLLFLVGALTAFNMWLLLVLVVAILPSFLSETHYAGQSYSLLFQWTPQRRELDYLRFLTTSDTTAKEIKTFRLSGHFTGRYARLAHDYYQANKWILKRRASVGAALSAVATLAYYSAVAMIVAQTVMGVLTLGTMTFLVGSFDRSRGLLSGILYRAAGLYEHSLYLRDLFGFFAMKSTVKAISDPRPFPRPIRIGFEFQGVGFAYPGATAWAVRDLTFRIGPGEKLALVGENGAGKTTLIKLLMRHYEPTEGRILLDGVDVRNFDPDDLRSRVGVVYQDFVRYDLTLRENVATGCLDALTDERRLLDAAQRAQASEIVDRLPQGLNHMLGRRFEGGADLSGGEWQRIALARAYVRNADLIVLDEPTAGLDAKGERAVFERFDDLTSGKMAVLISHRFSTVRMADRILLLEDGRVMEQGNHNELVALGGRYAKLFSLQAEGYK